MKAVSYILMLALNIDMNAHSLCKDDLVAANILYEKTINYANEKEELDNALHNAKRFQLEAYEFKSICQERLESDNKKYTYKRIVKGLAQKEVILYQQGLLANKILSN